MRVADVQLLYDYSSWAHGRIIRRVLELTPAEYVADAGFGRGGVRGTLAHTLGAELRWRARWQGPGAPEPVEPACATPADLAAAWDEHRAAMRAFLATLGDDDLARDVAYRRSGRDFAHPLWTQIVHVVNHGTQHRAEVAAMLTGLGRSPGDIDLSRFLQERG